MNAPKPSFISIGLLAVLFVAGCQTNSPSHYISPRVTGRVLDAQTHQPLAGVQVQRVSANENLQDMETPRGGKAIEKAPPIRTGADGSYVLDSERALTFFQKAGWYSVTLSFQHAKYEPFVTTYTITDATPTPGGEPLVKAKDILLIPLAK